MTEEESKFHFVHGRKLMNQYNYFLDQTNHPMVAAILVKVVESRELTGEIHDMVAAIEHLDNTFFDTLGNAKIGNVLDAIINIPSSLDLISGGGD